MFKKILIANRGEIAVRVIRTCRDMGIRTVAIYSEADAGALHVRMADEAVCVGPAASRESYLNIPNIIAACKKTGAEAVHPGFGFLSERAEFVRACDAAGIVFIGPPAEAMDTMGMKTTARRVAEKAGAPIVPGTKESFTDMAKLTQVCKEIGFPVLLKAAAGGGGKGMRLVEKEDQVVKMYERARSEAANAFGNDEVYVEKFVTRPRHIEVQVFADHKGNVLHFFDRECTIQRRHQKVIEEAPSDFVRDDVRPKLYEAAIAITRQVDYRGAGTIEFVMGPDQNFYFLEMNTRLQVEHPVTEMITGVDLVRCQILTAANQPLEFDQSGIQRRGYALECRVYAEDPAKKFMPSPGPLNVYRMPSGPNVRVDTGVYEGSEISIHYDPMIAKVAVWALAKREACARMQRVLQEYVIQGVKTSIPFHQWILGQEKFITSDYDTSFIDILFKPDLMASRTADADILAAAALAACLTEQEKAPVAPAGPALAGSQWRNIAWRGLRSNH